jgi:hypothetical protein
MKRIEVSPDQFVDLVEMYGPLLGNDLLAQALGFPSTSAFRQARRRGLLGVRTFKIAGRRGRFALTDEVATWIQSASEAR